MKRPLSTALLCTGAVGVIAIGWALARGTGPRAAGSEPIHVTIEAPEPVGKKKKKPSDDSCRTSCSLAKHDIAEITFDQFQQALAKYAEAEPDAPGEALETLLFYRYETQGWLESHGTGPLPPRHIAFLRKQLAVTSARVSIRVVDAKDRVRQLVDDVRVPLGVKQHLKPPPLDGVQQLEFNGTVMRVGLYHLWSRY